MVMLHVDLIVTWFQLTTTENAKKRFHLLPIHETRLNSKL